MPAKVLILIVQPWPVGGRGQRVINSLVDEIKKHVLAAAKIHADDTPVPVLAPGNGKTKTGRLWTYVRDDRPAGCSTAPAVWFAYSQDRKGEHPRRHLKDFKGAPQADAYSGFHHLYGDGAIYEVACWAHTRRKFTTSMWFIDRQLPPRPSHVSESCTASRSRSAESRQNFAARSVRFVPGRCSMNCASGWRRRFAPLDQERDRRRDPLCALTLACADTLRGRWALEIDNNAAERALRAVAIGRKITSSWELIPAARRAASLYSLIGTAKLSGIDPAFYLRTVLAQIAGIRSTASRNCCPGKSPPHSNPTLPKPLRSTQQVSANK